MPSSASEPSLPRRGGRRGGGADTRGDILRAARTQFANGGYEATTVRAIAREAMVDPSLIIQYFGGKDGLFQLILDEAVRPSEGIEPLTGLEPEQIGRKLAAYFFGIWEDPERRNPFQAMLVSAGENQAAAKVLRAFVREEVIARLGGLTRGADSALRAELAGSHLIGSALVRYVYRIPPLCDAPLPAVIDQVGATIQRYFSDVPSVGPR